MRKIISIAMTAVIALGLCGCADNTVHIETSSNIQTETTKETAEITVTAKISKDEKFGAANIALSQEEFEEAGFTLGDSCDILFSNEYVLEDVPYYNGYYVKNGKPVIVAYPGNATILVTFNNEGIWDAAGFSEDDTATITLNTAGEFDSIQSSLGQIYSFDRNDYTSDEEFCNFRALSGGNLKENYLFRGASPVDNSRKRAEYTDSLLEKNDIKYIIDLADSEDNMKSYLENTEYEFPYTASIYNDNDMILLDRGSAYTSDTYKEKVAEGLRFIIGKDGRVYIHCMEGKDRTGFVCTLIEALCGASYDEMLSDYMMTYKNYYKVSEKTPEKYEAIAELYFDSFMECLHGTDDEEELKDASFVDDAKKYLSEGGMSETEINDLVTQLSE